MNIINHPVEVNKVKIMNQILNIVCLPANFHPNSDFNCHTLGTNHWSIFLAKWHLTSHLHQSISPIHLCSCLMKSNEFGWKFASKQTISSIWFIILTLLIILSFLKPHNCQKWKNKTKQTNKQKTNQQKLKNKQTKTQKTNTKTKTDSLHVRAIRFIQ